MEYVLDTANLTVEVYGKENPNVPFLKQPFDPRTGKAWSGPEAMNEWAESFVVGMQLAKAAATETADAEATDA